MKKTRSIVHDQFCHIGINQMTSMLKPHYSAKNLSENIKKICRNCEICIKNKTRCQVKYGLMSQLGPAKKPFEIMSIDTIGGFGGSRSTKKYLHLMVDHFTRFTHILTSKSQSAKDFIKLTNIIEENEEIGKILTDQYPGINSKEYKDFLKIQKYTDYFYSGQCAFFQRSKRTIKPNSSK